MTVNKVPAATAAEIRERLQQIVNLTEAEAQAADGADTVTVNVLVGYFSSDPRS